MHPDRTGPAAIAAGPDGTIWAANGTEVIRITDYESATVYPQPITTANPAFPPVAITVGKDGALWLGGNCTIARITENGASSAYAVPDCGPSNQINGITSASDGAIWFTDGANLGRIDGACFIIPYPGPVPGPANAITLGPGGELWFTEGADFIGEAFFVTASLTVSPESGSYRTEVTFTGSGFAPNETVQVFAHGIGSAVLATAAADATGAFTVRARIPRSPAGARVFVGVGQSSRKLGAASFTVVLI